MTISNYKNPRNVEFRKNPSFCLFLCSIGTYGNEILDVYGYEPGNLPVHSACVRFENCMTSKKCLQIILVGLNYRIRLPKCLEN